MTHLILSGALVSRGAHNAATLAMSGPLLYAIQVAAYLALGLAFVSALARRSATRSRSIRAVWALLAAVMLTLAGVTAYQSIAGSAASLSTYSASFTTPRPEVALTSLALALAVLAYQTISQIRRAHALATAPQRTR